MKTLLPKILISLFICVNSLWLHPFLGYLRDIRNSNETLEEIMDRKLTEKLRLHIENIQEPVADLVKHTLDKNIEYAEERLPEILYLLKVVKFCVNKPVEALLLGIGVSALLALPHAIVWFMAFSTIHNLQSKIQKYRSRVSRIYMQFMRKHVLNEMKNRRKQLEKTKVTVAKAA